MDGKWSNWAVEMMMAGFETEHLIELVGIEKPFNQFELSVLTTKVFNELKIDFKIRDRIIIDYSAYLVKEVFQGKRDLLKTLRDLKNLCIEVDYDPRIYDFYSLYFAKEDLNYSENQWYWKDANRSNIDHICFEYFNQWLSDHKR